MSNNYPNHLNNADVASLQKEFRLDIQGLRAIAVLAVLAYHADSAWLKGGFVGVDIFFVISGFIITSLLAQSEKISFATFCFSRIRRIFPAYLLMLMSVCVISTILFLPKDFSFFYESLKSSALFISNRYFADFGSYFAPSSDELPLLHTWSLAIEIQFYLFFPLLMMFLKKSMRLSVFIGLAVGLFTWSGYSALQGKEDTLYFSLLARIPEFMVGSIVALVFRQRELPVFLASVVGWLGALLLVYVFLKIDKQFYPGFWSILPCLGAAMLIVARRGPINELLAIRPMVWIGGISYSLYLWHWPILAFIRYYTGQYELTTAWLLAFISCSFLLAWLSYRFVETPARISLGSLKQAPKWLLAACAFLVVVWAGQLANVSLVSPLPVELTRYAAPKFICHGTEIGSCKRGSAAADVSVLVIGDSHAAQLNHFFDQAGTEQGLGYQVITASSCVPIPGFDVERLPAWAQQPCQNQMNAVAQALPKVDRIIIAGMWQYQMQSPVFVEALRTFLQNAARSHKKIVVLAQIPMFESNVQRVQRFREIGFPAPLVPNHEWRLANTQVEYIVNNIAGVKYLDLSDSIFFATAPYHEDLLIYTDNHHLNEIGSRRYGSFMAAQLQRALD